MSEPVYRTDDDTNPKDIQGAKKPGMSKIPPTALIALGVVHELGAKKYGKFNWRQKKVQSDVYLDAIKRHLAMYEDGLDLDEESGESHLAHVMACCAILIDAKICGKLVDQRVLSDLDTSVVYGMIKDRSAK